MGSKEIWYGVLEAGEKSSPVVLDSTMDSGDNKIYLYNYVRDQFIEYAKAIVEPKLRELVAGDISRNELDTAFKAALIASSNTRNIKTWADTQNTATTSTEKTDETIAEIDIENDDEVVDFIDDD